MKKIIFFLLVAVMVALSSCSTTSSVPLVKQYPKMYEERPLTIAVMPPINQTTHAEAKDYFYTTMYMPLCEKGYYVYSPYLTMEMFQTESAYDSELFIEGDLNIFNKVLGADAVMFTIVKDWSRNNLGGKLTAHVEYILRSTKTGDTLYQREGVVTVDTSVSGGQGALGALVNMAVTAIATASTDKVEAGRKCTAFVLSNMPSGKYHPMFDKDQQNPAGDMFLKGSVKK